MIHRIALLLIALSALLMGLWAGLARAGWALPQAELAVAHGPLMVCGFLGTLIGLERAIAVTARLPKFGWIAYSVPFFAAVGAFSLVLKPSPASLLMTISSWGLTVLFLYMFLKHAALFTGVMALGAFLWMVGNATWLLGQPFYQAVPAWMGFLVLTIAGERLELSRIRRISRRAYRLFGAAVALYLVGIALTYWDFDLGWRVIGLGLIALAVWLVHYDIARKTIRRAGAPGFIATCLLSGYGWLMIGGGLALAYGGVKGGLIYDALLHSVFVGFVFAMIFGHALIIFPAVLNAQIAFHERFYLWLGLFHGTMALRLITDLDYWAEGRQWAGLLNALMIVIFLGNLRLAMTLPRLAWPKASDILGVGALGAVGLGLLVLGGWLATLSGTAPDEEAQAGKTAFMQSCAFCHDTNARGMPGLGSDLVRSELVGNLSDEELHAFIVQGRPADDPANTTGIAMPPRGGFNVSDEKIDHIIAYLRSLRNER